jgi:hypothetical protein
LACQLVSTRFRTITFASGTYEFNRDNADFKVNYNPTEKSSVFGRYSFSPSLIFDPPSLGAAGGDALNGGQPGRAPGLIQSAAIGGTYTVSPRVLHRRQRAALPGSASAPRTSTSAATMASKI